MIQNSPCKSFHNTYKSYLLSRPFFVLISSQTQTIVFRLLSMSKKFFFLSRFEKQIPSKQVKLNDKLEIDCDKESTVYLVDSESFHSCQISNKIAFRCSGRRRERKILKIAEVSPSPNAILYQPNREYFFIGKFWKLDVIVLARFLYRH